MAAPSGVTPHTTGVIIEMDILDIVPQNGTSVYGTVVTIGATVTLCAVDDKILMKNYYMFSQGTSTYAIADETDYLFINEPIE